MNSNDNHSFFHQMCKIGTPECAVFSAVIAMALGLLLLLVGFWNTVWIALLLAVGAFLGGVKDKKQWLKDVLNRIIPNKDPVAYKEQRPDISRAIRKDDSEDSKE